MGVHGDTGAAALPHFELANVGSGQSRPKRSKPHGLYVRFAPESGQTDRRFATSALCQQRTDAPQQAIQVRRNKRSKGRDDLFDHSLARSRKNCGGMVQE
jgi:hypothetical protein